MHEDVLTYGVSETRHVGDKLDGHIEEIEYLGYTIIDSGMTASDLDEVRASIDRYYEEQLVETVTASAATTIDKDILRCPLAYNDVFLRVAILPLLMEICKRALGSSFVLLQQNAIINRPASKEFQSRWHRDLPYQHFVISKKLALNALLCVDEFSVESGSTVVLPGTHMFEEFPSTQFVKKYERALSAKAGSVIIMDAMLFHRSGHNISAQNRRGVNHLVGRPMLVQQMDLPRLLNGRHSDDPFLRRYLGYHWNPAASVAVWRIQRSQ